MQSWRRAQQIYPSWPHHRRLPLLAQLAPCFYSPSFSHHQRPRCGAWTPLISPRFGLQPASSSLSRVPTISPPKCSYCVCALWQSVENFFPIMPHIDSSISSQELELWTSPAASGQRAQATEEEYQHRWTTTTTTTTTKKKKKNRKSR